MTNWKRWMAAGVVVPLVLGCGEGAGGSGAGLSAVAEANCASGKQWTAGNSESPLMNPGQACIACHTSGRGEGPRFTVAGTVYGAAAQADRCAGVEGVTVEITDAKGVVTTIVSNAAGNFSTQKAISLPYTARVVTAAGERKMAGAQSSGDCNGCHTQSGTSGAPGRVLTP